MVITVGIIFGCLLKFACGDDLDVWNFAVQPQFILSKPGQYSQITLQFETAAADLEWEIICDDEQLPDTPLQRCNFKNVPIWKCSYNLMANGTNTQKCYGKITAKVNENNATYNVTFKVGPELKVNENPVVAWKGFEANFAFLYETYQYPLICKLNKPGNRYTAQGSCNITLHNTDEHDAGPHNYSICMKDFPESCVTGEKQLIVLKKEKTKLKQTLKISAQGGTDMEHLTFECSGRHPNSTETEAGKLYITWNGLMDASHPAVQVYKLGELMFNDTVRVSEDGRTADTNGLSTTSIIFIIIAAVFVVAGAIAGVVFGVKWCKRNKKLCYAHSEDLNAKKGSEDTTPLKGMDLNATSGSGNDTSNDMDLNATSGSGNDTSNGMEKEAE